MNRTRKISLGVVIVGCLVGFGIGKVMTSASNGEIEDNFGATFKTGVPRVAPTEVPWRTATAQERAGAIRSITAQLDAFRRDDYQTATKYQSAGLKSNFPSVAAFRQIIKNSYPQFANYKKAQFGAAQANADGSNVNVLIRLTGKDGVEVNAAYQMAREDGIYRVQSVSGGFNQKAPQENIGNVVDL